MHKITIRYAVISFVIFVLIYYLVNGMFATIDKEKSSCGLKTICIPKYDLTKHGKPLRKVLCTDMVKCGTQQVEEATEIDTSSLDSFDSDFRVPSIGCTSIGGLEICCRGDLLQCFAVSISLMLKRSNENEHPGFNTYLGFSLVFSSIMCRFLPSCFIENDAAPYILFPVPDFYSLPWKEDDEKLIDPVKVRDTNLNKATALAFGNLGAMPMSPRQAVVYVINLPPRNQIKYFSLTPYMFQTGKDVFENKFAQDLPFASLTDPFNIFDLINMENEKVYNWMNDQTGTIDLALTVIVTHNKNIAIEVHDRLSTDENLKARYLGINLDSVKMLNNPIVCIPIPAGSTYGSSYDPSGNPMLKSDRTNKQIVEETPLYDWETETVGIVGRFTPELDYQDEFSEWKDSVNDQKNIFVVGIDDKSDTIKYNPFVLRDQNGRFSTTMDKTVWKGGNELDSTKYGKSSWKKQKKMEETNQVGNDKELEDELYNITQQMKDLGYDTYKDVSATASPSPFPHYNSFVNETKGMDKIKNKWSQSGVDILQYNVNTYGDCRDTLYPTSDMFCMGKEDVLVVISKNYMNHEEMKITYNALNIYDSESQTSLASLRGDEVGEDRTIITMAASRTDLTCNNNFYNENTSEYMADKFLFLPTGPHSVLGASTTTSFFVQNRLYVHDNTTSPSATDKQTSPIIRIFSPCKKRKRYPEWCNDYETDGCYYNDANKKCKNDLSIKYENDAKTNDTLTSDVCGIFRLNKTTDKTTISVVYFSLLSVFLISLLLTVIFIFLRNRSGSSFAWNGAFNDSKPLIIPFILLIILVVMSNKLLTRLTEATASDINQDHKQFHN